MSAHRIVLASAILFTASLLAGCPKTEYWNHDVVPISDYDINQRAVSAIEVLRSLTIKDLNVTVNVTHPSIGDCDAWLESPEAEIVPLVFGVVGANLENTTLNDNAAEPINTGTAPYTGSWQVDSFYVNAGMFLFDSENAKKNLDAKLLQPESRRRMRNHKLGPEAQRAESAPARRRLASRSATDPAKSNAQSAFGTSDI
jgi:hypothetical protein